MATNQGQKEGGKRPEERLCEAKEENGRLVHEERSPVTGTV